MYTLLLGLDGEATIGGEQVSYNILDESDNEFSPSGQIEEEAWRQFQEHTKQGVQVHSGPAAFHRTRAAHAPLN